MPQLSSMDPVLGFAIGLAFAFLMLLSLEIYNGRRVSKLISPGLEIAKRRAEEEARRLLEMARSEARKIVSEAETAGLARAATLQQEGRQAERAYEAALGDVLVRLEKKLEEDAGRARDSQEKIASKISAQLDAEATEARSHLAEGFSKIEGEYRSRLEAELTAAITAAKDEAAGYERARKAAIDEHIAAIVSETMRLVLQRGLPKEIHADLVRAALEEAKMKGIF